MTLLQDPGAFEPYGLSHWLVLGLFGAGLAALVALGRRYRGTRTADALSRSLAAVLVAALVPLQVRSMLPGHFDLDYSLPLQLCDLSWLTAVWALWARARWAFALTYYWGLTLTSQALVTPALTGPDFFSEQFVAFWALHLLVVWAAVYLTWGLGMRPDWSSWSLAVAATVGWALAMVAFNAVAGTNYGFLNAKPPTGSLLDILGPWPWYLLTELCLGLAVEFAARMRGEPYAAGGIRSTVSATRQASDEQLAANLARLTGEMLRQGTTTVEVKSGYGLTVRDEARSLALAREVTEETTFLGAHVVPPEHADDAAAYVALVTGPMLAACAPFARWVDVFCELRGAFDAEAARAVLTAGMAAGLQPRVHANQLGHGPGVRLACELGAASADHCTYLDDADVQALADSGTVATLLPGAEFSTRSNYPDARRLLRAGVRVALATDCNPGTSYTSSMPFCIALAVREMGMSPAEALWSATAGGALALRRDDIGVLRPGARADFVVLTAPSYVHLAYRPGVPLVGQVWKDGRPVTPMQAVG
ncbi:MAG: imidazolonepropionase [Actinobacteria bacterium]|nr:imidazolonepropionase [Actinomycetota bacterium]